MKPKEPVPVQDVMAAERSLTLQLLKGLKAEQWAAAIACEGWDVKDIPAHLLGDDLSNPSGVRDGYSEASFSGAGWSELVGFINARNARNEAWVSALRRLSPDVLPDVLIELLGDSGARVQSYFEALDPEAAGPNVAWAGAGPMPNWVHVAREYTERWTHGWQIREALDLPVLSERRFLYPVLGTFVLALPVALRDHLAPEGTSVVVDIAGHAGGTWSLVRSDAAWELLTGVAKSPAARVELGADTAWRLWTRGLQPSEARAKAVVYGDEGICDAVLDGVAMIV